MKAAIGYMLPEGSDMGELITDLQERVAREADKVTGCYIVDWNGHTHLKHGFGDLTAAVQRVGWWEIWTIARQLDNQSWPILQWQELKVAND